LATLYCNSGLWSDAGSWWLNAACTSGAGRVPNSGDDVILLSSVVDNFGPPAECNTLSSSSCGISIPVIVGDVASFSGGGSNFDTIYGNATYASGSSNQGTVTGNATFSGDSANAGVVGGNAVFNDTSGFYASPSVGSVSGNATFTAAAINASRLLGTVGGQVIFSSLTQVVVTADYWPFSKDALSWVYIGGPPKWLFTSGSGLTGRVLGDAEFSNNASCQGTVQGNAKFASSSLLTGGVISGDCELIDSTLSGPASGSTGRPTINGNLTMRGHCSVARGDCFGVAYWSPASAEDALPSRLYAQGGHVIGKGVNGSAILGIV
jgi:hypothetical protein